MIPSPAEECIADLLCVRTLGKGRSVDRDDDGDDDDDDESCWCLEKVNSSCINTLAATCFTRHFFNVVHMKTAHRGISPQLAMTLSNDTERFAQRMGTPQSDRQRSKRSHDFLDRHKFTLFTKTMPMASAELSDNQEIHFGYDWGKRKRR